MRAKPDSIPDSLPAAVREQVEAIDAREWDRVVAAEQVADLLLANDLPRAAALRLADSARSCDLAAQFTVSARLWESIAAIDSLDETLVDSALVRAARAYGSVPDHRAQRSACLQRLWELAEASGDDDRMARASYLRYLAAEVDGTAGARDLLDRGSQLDEASGWVWQCRSLSASLDDDPGAAVDASRRALARARAQGDLLLELRAVEGIAWYESFEGSTRTAIEVFAAAVELARREGDLDAVLHDQLSLAHAHLHELELDAADSRLDRLARDVPAELEESWSRLVAAVRSNTARFRGRLDDALDLARTAVAGLADDVSFRARDVVAVQAWFDAAIEVGALADARSALARLEHAADHSGDEVARRDVEWARLRLHVADGEPVDAAWQQRAEALLIDADMWLEGCIAADGARIAAWHGNVELADAIASRVRTTRAVPFVELRRGEATAVRALLFDGDVRPLRVTRHRLRAVGAQVDAARLSLFEAMVDAPTDEVVADARRAFRELVDAGAERDTLEALDVLPWLEQSRDVWVERVAEAHHVDAVERALVDHGSRITLETGAVRGLDDDVLVVVSGFACLRDETGGCVGVSGPASVIDAGVARSDGAVELQASRPVELVRVTSGHLPGAWWRPDAAHVRPVLDARIDAKARLERLIDALVERWGTTDEHGTSLACGVSQGDLGSMVGASRKTATLAIAQLRADGSFEARRGVLSRR